MVKSKYCRECLRYLKEYEIEDGICKICKEKLKDSKYENLYDYNYSNDNNPKDAWDNQSVYTEGYYEDEWDW